MKPIISLKAAKRVRTKAIDEDITHLPAKKHSVSHSGVFAFNMSYFGVAKTALKQAEFGISAWGDFKRRTRRWPSPHAAFDFPPAEFWQRHTLNFMIFSNEKSPFCKVEIAIRASKIEH